jgi:hypothetical protein
MSLSSKDQRAGVATTRRSNRINAADLTSGPDTTSSVFVSLPDGPSRRSTRASATSSSSSSSSSDQVPAKPSKSAESSHSDSVLVRRNAAKGSSKKRKKLTRLSKKTNEDTVDYILKPIEAKERQNWKGWCEVESEPVSIDSTEQTFIPDPHFIFQISDLTRRLSSMSCFENSAWMASKSRKL